MAYGWLSLWLIEFPLRQRQPWAWWTLMITNGLGFASFFTYLAYGYLDTWHACASVTLGGAFVIGILRTRTHLFASLSLHALLSRSPLSLSPVQIGMASVALGLVVGGTLISCIGISFVRFWLRLAGPCPSRLSRCAPSCSAGDWRDDVCFCLPARGNRNSSLFKRYWVITRDTSAAVAHSAPPISCCLRERTPPAVIAPTPVLMTQREGL